MSELAGSAYQELEASLNATNVLSEDYKGRVLSLALRCYSEGHAAGTASRGVVTTGPPWPGEISFTFSDTGKVFTDAGEVETGTPQPFTPSIAPSLDTTDRNSIIEHLRDVADEDAEPVRIDYVDEAGNRTTDRLIIPLEVQETGWGSQGYASGELLHAFDTEKDAPRNFRVDRIERLVA